MIKKCPICGYPLQLRWKKNYGLKLWMCTNEPEICNYITNDVGGGDLSIQKCDRCKDGYLIVKKGTSGAVLGCTNYKSDGTGCDRLMSRDYYLRWLTTGYEEDTSVDKPSFAKVIEPIIPEVKPVKNTPVKEERKKPQVHTVEYQEKFIEKVGFSVVVDNEGQIITDMKLLSHLRSLRMQLAKKEQKAPYLIIKNKGLVSLATYRPTTKEEFINLNGLGETTYNNYGVLFANAIKEFYNN
jgi:ssDNA-binding Zn-finger/Zn-ribbon topoisomerase 1